MDSSGLSVIIILGVIFFVWILPLLVIMNSRKTTKSEKIAWLIPVIFISWFAWILYLLLAPIKKKH